MSKFECPICENENIFEKLFNHHVYLIGFLLVSNEVNKNDNIDTFFKSTLANCRNFYRSKQEKKGEVEIEE